MTVLDKRAANDFESKRIGTFVWVGMLGLLVGIAVAMVFGELVDEPAVSSEEIGSVSGVATDDLSDQLRALVRSYPTYAALRTGVANDGLSDQLRGLVQSYSTYAAVRAGVADDGLSSQLRDLVQSYSTYAALRTGVADDGLSDQLRELVQSYSTYAALRSETTGD